MRNKSPITEWREQYGVSVGDPADLSKVTDADITRGENVSAMAHRDACGRE